MKSFSDTAIFRFLKNKGLLHLIVDNPGFSNMNALKENILNNSEALSLTPDELRQFNEAYNSYISELDMRLRDVADARERELTLFKAGEKNFTQNILAVVGILAFFLMAGYIIINGIAEMSSEASFIVGSVTGTIGGIAVTIYSYYFGSSKGSYDKTQTINKNMLKKNAP